MRKDDGFSLSPKMKKCAERLINNEFDGNISKLCDELGIARSTFYRWYDKKEFKQYINFLIDRYTETELLKYGLQILKKQLRQDIHIYFESGTKKSSKAVYRQS